MHGRSYESFNKPPAQCEYIMYERVVISDVRKRIKALQELVYPSIIHSMWCAEDKIRALYRHKVRVAKIIEQLDDDEEQNALSNDLEELYSGYIGMFGLTVLEVRKYEIEVDMEQEEIATQPGVSVRESSDVPTSTRWIKARVQMIMAQVMKRVIMHQAYAVDELAMVEENLFSLEDKLYREPDTDAKLDILNDIEKVKELLLQCR